ncbi:MAG: hypothetical protein Q8916_09650, partial [Bacteroidota bacterium]|nr:hypothetical protein [Bacteroidota bacterium]
MNKFVVFCLALPIFLAAASGVRAQGDILTVRPQSSTDNICAFNVTVSNHNTAQKNIDEIKFDIVSTNPDVTFYDFASPTHWTYTFDGNSVGIDVTSDNGGIAPNLTVSNFIFSYSGGNDQFDNPVTINWTTRNSGTDISTGTFQTTCTQFQQYDKLDTCTIIPSTSGADPCFTFTMVNRNLQGTFPQQSSSTIWNVAFQLLNINGGTLRPSKIIPAQGWVFDSATTYTAYFHTDNSPIDPGSAVGGWKICLRSNPNVTKCSFVWFAADDANALIDRDTVRNINSTATGSPIDA